MTRRQRPSVQLGVACALGGCFSAIALSVFALGAAPATLRAETLLNVSHHPTHESYRDVNEAYAKAWEAAGNAVPTIEVSHGGSAVQARAAIVGLETQVVTLALASDTDKISAAGKLPHNSGCGLTGRMPRGRRCRNAGRALCSKAVPCFAI